MEAFYFHGPPIALFNASTGAWTDMIWAGNNILAEAPGTQTATPVYRLLDHEGALVATMDNSGNVTGNDLIALYGHRWIRHSPIGRPNQNLSISGTLGRPTSGNFQSTPAHMGHAFRGQGQILSMRSKNLVFC